MKRVLSAAGVSVAMVAGLLALAAPAQAATIEVFAGESIQEAVHQAQPGDTILVHAGTYTESVAIRKDYITLQGEGASDGGTVLMPGTDQRACAHGAYGICVFSRERAVVGVTITGFEVNGFPVFGILGLGTTGLVIRDNLLADDGEYGAAAFGTVGTKMLDNVATGNAIGLYIGDAARSRSEIAGNQLVDNHGMGLFLRSAAVGQIHDNVITGNCVGIWMLNEGTITPHDWQIRDNTISANNDVCEADEEGAPPFAGTGVLIFGGDDNTLTGNVIARNRAGSGAYRGGVVLVSSFDPSLAPDGNRVMGNTFIRNRPNVSWDGTGRHNVIANNNCTPRC